MLSRRLFYDDLRRPYIGLTGHRFGRIEGCGHGRLDAYPFQGVNHYQQFYDRRNCCGERRGLPATRVYTSRAGYASGDWRFAGALISWVEDIGQRFLIPKSLRWVFAIVVTVVAIQMTRIAASPGKFKDKDMQVIIGWILRGRGGNIVSVAGPYSLSVAYLFLVQARAQRT